MNREMLEAENRELRAEVARLRRAVWGCPHSDRPDCGCPEPLMARVDRLEAENAALQGLNADANVEADDRVDPAETDEDPDPELQ